MEQDKNKLIEQIVDQIVTEVIDQIDLEPNDLMSDLYKMIEREHGSTSSDREQNEQLELEYYELIGKERIRIAQGIAQELIKRAVPN